MRLSIVGSIALTVTVAGLQSVSALPVLVGALLYSSSVTGANSTTYQYSTNSSTIHDPFLPLGTAISQTLNMGDNVFSFDESSQVVNPGSFAGLELFFNNTGVSFNPAHTGTGIPGDLAVFTPTDSSGTTFDPVTGTLVQSYETSNTISENAAYSGASSVQVDGYTITVPNFTSNTTPAGSFTVAVTPEPGTISLMGVGLAGLAAASWRRRQRAVKA